MINGLSVLPCLAIVAMATTAWAGSNPAMGETKRVRRGAEFSGAIKATLDEIAATPDKFAGKTVEVSGTVGTVCLKKGCWLGLVGTKPASKARVTFKGYAFFAPLDCTGARARIEGVVEVKKLSEADRAHLAKDAGTPVDQIPSSELRITASALELTRN